MKITLIAAITADGFIADGNGNGDFSSAEDKRHLREFLHSDSVDGFIVGRKTFAAFADRLAHKPSYVFTRNAGLTDTHNIVYCRNITELPTKTTHHFALLGGAEIYHHFLNNRLIDEMFITVEENITFGSGTSLNLTKYLPKFDQVQVLQLSPTTKVLVYCRGGCPQPPAGRCKHAPSACLQGRRPLQKLTAEIF